MALPLMLTVDHAYTLEYSVRDLRDLNLKALQSIYYMPKLTNEVALDSFNLLSDRWPPTYISN